MTFAVWGRRGTADFAELDWLKVDDSTDSGGDDDGKIEIESGFWTMPMSACGICKCAPPIPKAESE